jgi:hypothetical protein
LQSFFLLTSSPLPFQPLVIDVLDWELSTLGNQMADVAYNCLVCLEKRIKCVLDVSVCVLLLSHFIFVSCHQYYCFTGISALNLEKGFICFL